MLESDINGGGVFLVKEIKDGHEKTRFEIPLVR